MCSIPGLPTPGSNVSVLITKVNLNPLCVIIELWGNFDQERKKAYQRLKKDIQFPRETFRELEGNHGDHCLVQAYETWYRARIASRNGSNYSVFLIDEGRTLGATTSMLAWGQTEFFQLPPEVEFCVLANVLPLSPENRWSPMALEFMKSLCGSTVTACVQDVLVPHRAFLLDIPNVSRQMYEMGFAKKLTTERFKIYVSRSLQSHSGALATTESQQIPSMRNEPLEIYEQIEKQQHYMYPELQTETVETVIITEVTNPLRVFCQLKVFSQELKKLTEQITQHYEGRVATGIARPETLGSPCASRGSDGRWYRSVLQQVFPANNVVEVLQVDYGKKQFVQVENIRLLATEFFRMPVVTYVCSLHGIIDKGVGWTASQIDYLKSLLLNRTLIAKFEYQSLSEGVHYVTLYGDENKNINNLFGAKEKCLLECEKSHGNYAVHDNAEKPEQNPVENQRSASPPSAEHKEMQAKFPEEALLLNSSHVAVVQHVKNPSEFWIQTQRYANEFDQLMDDLAYLYSNPDSTDVVKNPTVGLYCAAKSQDDAFYRATVSEVTDNQVRVFFIDYGNTETIDWFNLWVLPGEFQRLPALALKCRLAGVRPKEDKWSPNAIVSFTKSVLDKILDVHVTAKHNGAYVVQLTDPSGDGERDVSMWLCSAGFAEKADTNKTAHHFLFEPNIMPTVKNPGAIPYDIYKTNGSPKVQPTTDSTVKDPRVAFQEYLFPIGSSVEVVVSYIESPNDFWCQQAQNTGHLKVLMQDIQNFYADSQIEQQPVEVACVARHPDNGMWYRALVIQKHATPHVDVLFIDYGQTKTVSLQELRRINPTFLKLQGQAFRCSLYNLILPTSPTTVEWSDDAIAQFQDFVNKAASNHVVLKCTIYAVMFDAQKVVFNVVDLETPFQSVCSLMVQRGLANRAPPKKAPPSPFRLDTYYYSTHGVKTGAEEEVSVTSVKNVNHFYCQLERNAHTVERLAGSVNKLCRQLEMTNCPKTFGKVCFAKYTDGLWYRGQIKSTQPTITVHFVDYGDTLVVDKADMLPVPIEASEIMSVPVQAVECGLSDIPGDVPSEVNSWFETSMTDQSFRALVVAKEPGGKLLVELYDKKTQVNAKIKEKFRIETHREQQVVYTGYDVKSRKSHDASFSDTQGLKAKYGSALKPARPTGEENHKREGHNLAPYRTPHQRQAPVRRNGNVENCPEQTEASIIPTKLTPLMELKPFQTLRSPICESQKVMYVAPKAKVQSLPKLSDLPSKCLEPGMDAGVFVSHCNSPLNFFVQLIKEEDDIYSIVEKLNDEQPTTATIDIKDLNQGDLVNAEFPDDSSWYRAVVREMLGNGKVLVEFIDFGNTATVSASKMCRLAKQFLELPRFSIPCFLSGAPAAIQNSELDPEVVSNFKEAIDGSGDKEMKCRFMKQTGSVWEVSLEEGGSTITCNASPRDPTALSDVMHEKTESPRRETEKLHQSPTVMNVPPEKYPEMPNLEPQCYLKADITDGEVLDVYASSVIGPQSFWCQSADSDNLDKITEIVSEAGKAVEYKSIHPETLCAGSPCIALFTDDEQWYRAEVIRKDGDVLSVLFVDYGNESKVKVTDVRPMPPGLIETPPQAFLCQLEGFDVSQGSWDDSAADQFSELTAEKLLTLTFLRISSDEGGATYYVQVECDGQVINEVMQVHWKSSVNSDQEDKDRSDVTGKDNSCDVLPLPCESKLAIKETAVADSVTPEPSGTVQEHDTGDGVFHSDTHEEVVGDEKYTDNCDKEPDISVIITQATDVAFTREVEYHAEQTSTLENIECDDLRLDSDTEPFTDDQQEEKDDGSEFRSVIENLMKHIPEIVVFEEVVSDAGLLECVSESGVSREAQTATCHVNYDEKVILVPSADKDIIEIDEVKETGSASIMEQAFGLDDSESALYIDDNLEETTLSNVDQSHDDIYEEVFKLCAEIVLESTVSGPAVPMELEAKEEQSDIRDEGEENNSDPVPESDFDYLKRVKDTFPVGSTCAVWSQAHKSMCKAKVLKIFDDSTKVLLVDHDSEMVVDPQNMFELLFVDDCAVDEFDSASSHGESQQDEDEDTDVSEDTIAGDDPISTASEDMALLVDHDAEMVVDLANSTFDVVSAESDQVQDESPLCEVCASLEGSSDDPADQDVEIQEAAMVEVVTSAATQDKVDLLGEEFSSPGEESSCLDEDFASALVDGLADQGAEREEATDVEVMAGAPTQDKDDVLDEEAPCPVEDCTAHADVPADPGAETEDATDLEFAPSAATQDKDDVLEEVTSSPDEDCFELQMSLVTHLTLKVEDKSDDDVIFVSETRPIEQRQRE